jgi:hypothetical protein
LPIGARAPPIYPSLPPPSTAFRPGAATAAAPAIAPYRPPQLIRNEDRVPPRLGEGYQAEVPAWGGAPARQPCLVAQPVQLHEAGGALAPLQYAFLDKVSTRGAH